MLLKLRHWQGIIAVQLFMYVTAIYVTAIYVTAIYVTAIYVTAIYVTAIYVTAIHVTAIHVTVDLIHQHRLLPCLLHLANTLTTVNTVCREWLNGKML